MILESISLFCGNYVHPLLCYFAHIVALPAKIIFETELFLSWMHVLSTDTGVLAAPWKRAGVALIVPEQLG
eukprot:m.547 g.547  ORF g.547 m.547 type:complete len:71 (+) comp345_c0_seq1:139-351(+)